MAKASFTFTKNFNGKALNERVRLAVKAEAAVIGADAVAYIERQTGQGLDVDGNTFKAYAKDYAALREETKRQVSPPNLNWSGRMLAAMNYEVTEASDGQMLLRIFFNGPDEVEKARQNMRTRKFFGVSEKLAAVMRRQLKKAAKAATQKST